MNYIIRGTANHADTQSLSGVSSQTHEEAPEAKLERELLHDCSIPGEGGRALRPASCSQKAGGHWGHGSVAYDTVSRRHQGKGSARDCRRVAGTYYLTDPVTENSVCSGSKGSYLQLHLLKSPAKDELATRHLRCRTHDVTGRNRSVN